MRLRVTLISVFLLGALLAAGVASARSLTLVIDRGIVQSVSSTQLVLRALDGSTITITIGPRTRVLLNNDSAPLTAIQPGYVATALHDGSRPAVYVRAVGKTAPLVVDKGVITAVSSTSITLRTGSGLVMITIGPATSIQLNGRPAGVVDLHPGYSAEVAHRGSEPAQTIRARGSRR